MSAYFRRQVAWRTEWRGVRNRFIFRKSGSQSPPLGGIVKRIIDVVVACFALVPFLPLFGLVAAMIFFFEGKPVLYRHPRIGYGRRPFLCLKFRPMGTDGDEILRRRLQ